MKKFKRYAINYLALDLRLSAELVIPTPMASKLNVEEGSETLGLSVLKAKSLTSS